MNLSAKSNRNGFLMSNRYLEFGNAIREKYAQFQNQGGAPLLYAEQPASEEREETPARTQITNNYYTLRFLQQENVLYQQKLSFLLEVMEKRLQQNVYTTLEKQLEKVIREERTQAKPAEVRLLAKQARELLREGGAEPLEELAQSLSREEQTKQEQKKQEHLIRKITNLYNSSQLTQKYQTVRNQYLTQDLRKHQEIYQNLTVHQTQENHQNLTVHQTQENRQILQSGESRLEHQQGYWIQEQQQELRPKLLLTERWNRLLMRSPIQMTTIEAEPGRENPTGYIPPHLEYREEEPEARQQTAQKSAHQAVQQEAQRVQSPQQVLPEHEGQPGRMSYETFLQQGQKESVRIQPESTADKVPGKAVSANAVPTNAVSTNAIPANGVSVTAVTTDRVQEANPFYEPVPLSYQEETGQPGKSEAEREEQPVRREPEQDSQPGRMSYEAFLQQRQEETARMESANPAEQIPVTAVTADGVQEVYPFYEPVSLSYQEETGQPAKSEAEREEQPVRREAEQEGQPGRMSYEAFLQQRQEASAHMQPEIPVNKVSANTVSANAVSTNTVSANAVTENGVLAEAMKRIPPGGTGDLSSELTRGIYPTYEPAHLSYQEEEKQPEIEQNVRTVIREVLAQQRNNEAAGKAAEEQKYMEAASVKAQAETLSGRLVREVERLAAGEGQGGMPGAITLGVRKPGARTITQARVIGTVLQALAADGQPGRSEGARRLEERRTRAVREIQRIFLESESEPSLPETTVEERLVKVLMPFREEAARIYQSQEQTVRQAGKSAQPGNILIQAGKGTQPGKILIQPGKGLTMRFGKEPVLQWEEAPMIYEEDKEQQIRQADGQIRRLTQQTHEVLKEIQVIRNTTVTHEKIIEEQQQIQKMQEKRQKQEKLPAEQMRKAIDQEVYRSMEKQLDGSVNRIADKVYQKLESRLKSERSRRGLR